MRTQIISILSILVTLFLSLVSCNDKYIFTEVEEITNVSPLREGYEHFGIWSSCYITPDIGFSSVAFRDKTNNKRKYFIRKTSNGGKSWTNYQQSIRPVKNIQSAEGSIYAYYVLQDITRISSDKNYSVIISSTDMGESWNSLYKYQGVITDFIAFDSLTMVIRTEELNNSSDTDFASSTPLLGCLHITRDGGCSWSKLDGLPPVVSPIFRTGTKIYFCSQLSPDNNIYSYNINSRKITKRYFNTHVYMFNISDDMLSMDWHGSDISFWEIKENGEFDYKENLKWGSFWGGSFKSKYLAKDEKYVFSYSSMFPGKNDINRALFFSDNKGRNWSELKLFNRDGQRPSDRSFCSYHNDTLFQISYMVGDTTKMFRIKK